MLNNSKKYVSIGISSMKNFIDAMIDENRSISSLPKFELVVLIKKRSTKNKKTIKLNFITDRIKFDLIMFRKK